MFELEARKNVLRVRKSEKITSGSVNIYTVHFTFSPEWEGLSKQVVFKSGDIKLTVDLFGSDRCNIPWEAVQIARNPLHVGVYGTDGVDIILPTIWAYLGVICPGTTPNKVTPVPPPTPDMYDRLSAEIAKRGNKLSYETNILSLLSGTDILSSVTIEDLKNLYEITKKEVNDIWEGNVI